MEMEQDEERVELLREIAELLLSGGYFRAQISTLSPFDMLTGGLAWAIAASNVDVDFDVFYDDDATLGYKIKVGEAIEEALQRMGCPYPLQAHQIQGLDYPAVLLVVQWLVKRVLQNRAESGDQLRKYSLLKFHQNFKLPGEAFDEHTHPRKYLPRQFSGADPDQEQYLQTDLSELRLNDANAQQLDSQAIDSAALEKQLEFQKARIAQLQVKKDSAVSAADEISLSIKKQEEQLAELVAEREELQHAADDAGAGLVIKDIISLLKETNKLKNMEIEFRASCKKKRSELVARIKQLQDPNVSIAEQSERQADVETTYNAEMVKLDAVRKELAKKSREVARLQRQLDDVPTQSELIQYERRFVELYLHIQRKLAETRKYYATYNALAEAHELTMKETSLLNSIHSQFEVAMTTPGGRAKFVQSMDGIEKGVKQKLLKMEKRLEAEKDTYNALKEKHMACVTAQRNYFTLVKQFQEECAKNERLRATLEPYANVDPSDMHMHIPAVVSPLEQDSNSFVPPL